MQANAKADLRSIADYVAQLIEADLRKCIRGASPRVRGAGPDDRRAAYSIGTTVTTEQRERTEARAAQKGRSLLSYVATVILEGLARR